MKIEKATMDDLVVSNNAPTNGPSDSEIEAIYSNLANHKNKINMPQMEPVKAFAPSSSVSPFATPLAPQQDTAAYFPILDFPSKGKFYGNVEGRRLTVMEIKKISNVNAVNHNFLINDILRTAIRGVDINKMYVGDKIFFLFWLRWNAYKDSTYVIEHTCPKCEHVTNYHFDVDAMKVEYIKDDYEPDYMLTLPSGNTINFDYLKVEDEVKFDNFKTQNSKVLKDIDDDFLQIAICTRSINGEKMSLLEKYSWVCNCDPGDLSCLTTYINKNSFGVIPYVDVTCESCGGVAPMGISFQPDFYIPKYITL